PAMLTRAPTTESLIYICSPNNPTSSLTPAKDMEAFINRLPSSAYLLIDEAYHHFANSSQTYRSFIEHPVSDERVIVCRTFSKIYGMAGLRLGYAVASPQTSDKLRRYATVINVNGVVAAAAIAALQDAESLAAAVKRNADD